MELLKLMEERYSVRSFSDRAVEDEKIEAILQAGRLAPTACNNQPQKILVLKSRESLELWQKCTKCHFNEQLVMIVCYDRQQAWTREYDGQDSGFVDASIITTHMMLEAANEGIGSTWIMYFIPEAVREEFHLPENLVPVSVLAMGYASEKAAPSPRHGLRKPLTDTVVYDHF
ncbi:MAG: nitroreductase [Clostridiales bacterium]|nr:nitroreductase [Clostridiales bacterium]